MRFQIKHENAGRLRVKILQRSPMTMAQADELELALSRVPGVQKVTVHDQTAGAIILYREGRERILDALAHYAWGDVGDADLSLQTHSRKLNRYYTEKLVFKVFRRTLRKLFLPAPLRRIYTCVRSLPYLWRGLRCLWRRQLHVELLDALSIGISLARGDFGTAGSVRFLLEVGDLLDEWTHKKSVDDFARTMSLNIDQVWVRTDDETEVLLPITQVQAGDRVVVRVGGVVPLDGVIDSGEVMVNQASLTGESVPVPKRAGMTIYAGTVVEEGECVLRVEQQPGDTRYDKIVAMIEASEKLKSSVEQRASYLADRLVPYTLLGSGMTYLLTRNTVRALSVLMVDFSCALKLAMPLAVLSAMREAGNYGMTVKGGKFLEAIAHADTVVFDKTGTLTHACPQVVSIVPFGGNDENEMLRVAACLEEHFPHSMANAVVRAARERGLEHEEMHTQVEYIVAHGIRSTVNGKSALIGSHHFVFEDEGVKIPRGEKRVFNNLPDQYSHLYLAIGGKLAAVICIADPLRAEAREVIEELHRLGVKHTVMLTGDSERTAAAIAREVGVDEYRSEVLPEDKAAYVEQARAKGRTVIMIGDGINDSPALSAANVGVAIADGAAIAREIADVTISASDLRELIKLRQIAAALMHRIHRNYRFVIGFNGSLIALGALGVLPPATSAMLHNGSTIAVSVQSMTNLI
ncbi:MAG: heavy metal translocating P-type ATPase [Oscillospiraceae bacterium]|nr:heavy metal translocating P-type ATPase [Oscillospiraceae bacterium]MBQ6403274.1 heavy metal translocating P-type ATPase [Oscillospiraceae bacterium]